jgi:hypothetical protein
VCFWLVPPGPVAPLSASQAVTVTVALMLIITGLFTIIVRNHTEGGWKWRGL